MNLPTPAQKKQLFFNMRNTRLGSFRWRVFFAKAQRIELCGDSPAIFDTDVSLKWAFNTVIVEMSGWWF